MILLSVWKSLEIIPKSHFENEQLLYLPRMYSILEFPPHWGEHTFFSETEIAIRCRILSATKRRFHLNFFFRQCKSDTVLFLKLLLEEY